MRRGTTPTLSMIFEGINSDIIDEVYITVWQHSVEITKKAKAGEEENEYGIDLSQEETLKFVPTKVKVQAKIRLTDSNVIGTDIFEVPMKEILNEDII